MLITKILSYPVYPTTGDSYTYVCQLIDQSIDPHSNSVEKLALNSDFVYASPLRRSRESVDTAATMVTYLDELREIPFDLKLHCTRADLEQHGSTAVRGAFVKCYVNDTLHISRDQLRNDIVRLESLTHEHPEAHFVSHTFRMKIIELYYKTRGAIFLEPELLYSLIPLDEQIFAFGATIFIDNHALLDPFEPRTANDLS